MMISVIVTEYKKRGYLIHALRSVFNQTLDKDKYEVIVVKNEEDKEVDDYARKNGAKVIMSNERWLGPKIAQGLEEAKGDIISLLEDDDMFTQDKLDNVYRIFSEDKVSEVHNAIYVIDSNNNILSNLGGVYEYYVNKDNYIHKKYAYILGLDSCISIKRELIDNGIEYQKILLDVYLTISAICKSEDKNVLFYGKPLTYYRIHSQNTMNTYAPEKRIALMESIIEDYETLYNKFYTCSKEIKKTLKLLFLNSKLRYYLLKLYLTEENEKIEKDLKFSFSDKLFLLDPFNKPRKEFIVKGILASSFLFLPSSARFHLLKFMHTHLKTIDKMLEI
mgnify:FL=1